MAANHAFMCVHSCGQLFMSSPHSKQIDRRETDCLLFVCLIRQNSPAQENMFVIQNMLLML